MLTIADKELGPTLPISKQIHQEKHRQPGESFVDAVHRQAHTLCDSHSHFMGFKDIIENMRFMAAGRVQLAVGSKRVVTPFSCFVSEEIDDSMEGIMRAASRAATTMRLGGGIGYDFSPIRPRNDVIKSLDSPASGPVSFMGIFDVVCATVSSAGNRRGAQMATIRVDHPDIYEYIKAKQNVDKLRNFNTSVAITDKFMAAVINDRLFELVFKGRTYQTIRAVDLWNEIMKSTWDWAEPGVLFIDRINDYNNLNYIETIATTNPCVTGDTPILTSKGYVDIEDLEGVEVDIWNGFKWSSVTPFSTGLNPLVEVKLSNYSNIKCTPYHKFVLADETLVEAKDLQPGDKLKKFSMPVVEGGVDYSVSSGDGYSQGFYSGDGTKSVKKSWVYWPKYDCIKRLRGSVAANEHPIRRFKVWSHGLMLDKVFVPIDGTSKYCLDWLAGLLDADGTVQQTLKERNPSIQLTSIDKQFILDTKLMLTRLGVRATMAVSMRTDQRWSNNASWRLCINQTDTKGLLDIGLKTERLRLTKGTVQRDARQFIYVTGVEDLYSSEETFCVTEKSNGTCTFNGIVTANCAEQPLPPNGACLLGSQNLTKYLDPKSLFKQYGYDFNYEQFIEDIPHIVRAMDNVIDVATYPLPEQEAEAKNKRRIGLGITGVANAIEAMGHVYGSEKFVHLLEQILKILLNESYRASSMLAKEKGSFPDFDYDKFSQGYMFKKLDDDVKDLIKVNGLRNSHLTSIAPAGTISLEADNVSSGIEPVFSLSSTRTIKQNGLDTTVTLEDYGYRVFGVKGKTADECSVDDHLRVLLASQKWVDSAVSKTCNIGDDVTFDEFKDVYMNAWKGGAKGCTTFRASGKRMGIMAKAEINVPSTAELISEYKPFEGTQCYVDAATGQRSCG